MAYSPRNNRNRRQQRGRRNRNHTRGRQYNRDRAPQLPTPIKLSTDYKEADLLTAKIQRGANKKVVFVAKAGSTESYLFALRDFETKADALGMTLRDKVVNLQSILAFGYQATYQQAIIGLPAAGPIDQAQYDAVKATIASAICTNTDRSSLIEYIRTGCRHTTMPAREFFLRLDILVQYASMMPGPEALPTEDDIKKTFFGCQRPDDQAAFIQDAKKLPAAATRAELINFMEIRSTLRLSFPSTNSNNRNNSGNGRDNRDYSRNKNGGDGDRYDDRDSDNDHEYDDDLSSDASCSSNVDDESISSSNASDDSRNDDRDFNRNKRNGNRNRNGGNRNDDQARKRSRDMDKCPFHPEANHTWSDCFGNPNGRNWKPQFAARVADILAKAKSGSNNNKQGGDTDAHVHDD
jgi:hypothetical protein